MAAPTWAWLGTASGSTSASSPVYPASGVTAGDAIFAATWSKATSGTGEPPAISAPSGWTQVAVEWGGTGTAGVGTGPVKITVHRRNTDADGTENGVTLTSLISNPASSSFVYTNLFGVRPVTVGDAYTFADSGGSDTTAGTAFSVTVAADPGITADDLVLALLGWDIGTASGASAETITATSATIGAVTERMDSSTSSGNAVRGVISSAACTAGTSSAAAALGATSAASVTGVGMVLRVREVAAAGATPPALVAPPAAVVRASTW